MGAFVSHGGNPVPAVFIAFAGGLLAGMTTAVIHNELKIPNLLAGILTMIMLYSINLKILGSANVTLLNKKTILTDMTQFMNKPGISKEVGYIIFFLLLIVFIKILHDLFFRTDLGMTLGAIGNNEQMIIAQEVNPKVLKIIGVGLLSGFKFICL